MTISKIVPNFLLRQGYEGQVIADSPFLWKFTMKKDVKAEKAIVDFKKCLLEARSKKFRIIDRPERKNRTGYEPDFILGYKEERIIVEHTTMDSYINQSWCSKEFISLINCFYQKLNKLCRKKNDYIQMIIPIRALIKISKKKRSSFPVIIEAWLEKNLDKLPCLDKNIFYSRLFKKKIPGVPFAISFRRMKSYSRPGFYPSRSISKSYEKELRKIVRKALEHGKKKLMAYKKRGFQTILLIETNDISLMNRGLVAEAYNPNKRIIEGAIDAVFLIEKYPSCSSLVSKL